MLNNLLNRFGALFLTIILTRFLQPELFGIYSLTLSIILVLTTFTDLGINGALTKYISNALSKNNKLLARSYFKYLLKIKSFISIITAITLGSLAYPISHFIFQKPELFLPLLAGSVFLLFAPIAGLFESFFFITKKVKFAVRAEIIRQTFRIILSITSILVFTQINPVAGIFLAFTLSSLFFTSYALKYTYQKCNYLFKKRTIKIERKRLLKFVSYLSISSIGIIFLGSIDTLMLGLFVGNEYIGFYKVAINLTISFAAILNLAAVLLPNFSEDNMKKAQKLLKKVTRYISLIAIPCILGLVILGKETIRIIYGPEYLIAFYPLLILLPLALINPLIKVIITFFNGQEKANLPAKAVIITTLSNILLNYLFIKTLIPYGDALAILGAAIATLLSQVIFIIILIFQIKKETKKKLLRPIINQISPQLISAIIMLIPLVMILKVFNLSGFYKIILIPLGVVIYIISLILFKGIKVKEIKELSKSLLRIKTRKKQ